MRSNISRHVTYQIYPTKFQSSWKKDIPKKYIHFVRMKNTLLKKNLFAQQTSHTQFKLPHFPGLFLYQNSLSNRNSIKRLNRTHFTASCPWQTLKQWEFAMYRAAYLCAKPKKSVKNIDLKCKKCAMNSYTRPSHQLHLAYFSFLSS